MRWLLLLTVNIYLGITFSIILNLLELWIKTMRKKYKYMKVGN